MQKGILVYSGGVTVKGAFRQPNTSTEPVLHPIISAHETRPYQDEEKYSVFRWEFKRGGGERGKCNEWMARHMRRTRRQQPTLRMSYQEVEGSWTREEKHRLNIGTTKE